MTNYVNCKNSEGTGVVRKLLKSEQKNILLIFMGFTGNNKGTQSTYVSNYTFKATARITKRTRYEELPATLQNHPSHYPIPTALCATAGTVTDS
ncbi:hypothetical protein ACNKHT_21360 [Shigella flexneri]